MVHSDMVISTNKKKNKRKRGKSSDALPNVDLISSEMVHSDVVISPKQGKKKKKNRNKGENTDALANVELIQQPIGVMGLVTDSRLEERAVKVEDCDDIRKSSFGHSSLSKDNNISGRDSSTIVDTKITLGVNVNQVPKASVNPVSEVNVSEKLVTVPLQMQKTKRKKKKKNLNGLVRSVIVPSTSVIGASKFMQHSAGQGAPQGIHLNECPTKGKNCSGEDSSGMINMKVDETSVSQGKTVGNMQGGKKRKRKRRGKNLNLEPKEGVISSNGFSEEQQVKTAKVNADQNAGIGRMLTDCAHKKLLILDLNGLLADVVGDKTIGIKADGNVAGKKIFKRPFCEDFLQFCFEKFTVGVWSSRRKKNVSRVLQVLMPERERSKLAFKWNQSHCTKTGLKTIENSAKPLFLKELSKLWKWANKNRQFSSKVRDYDKSNTLLLDDSPYKALKNPPYTAIFPTPFQYQDQNDNALGPGGDLRVYLEGLALAEDVQKYVEQNPFGQKSITDSDPSWSFYAKVHGDMSQKQTSEPNRNKSIIRRKRDRFKSNQSSKSRVDPASKSVPV